MAYAIYAVEPGGAEVLERRELAVSAPEGHQVQIEQQFVGVNYIDIYLRSGLYPWPSDQPFVLGVEASGVVSAVGEQVEAFQVGDRVAYVSPNGAYCSHRNIRADHVVPVPDEVSLEQAAAVMLKGLTAAYLLNDSFAVKAGDTVLFHAAAGGVGSIAGQWLRQRGVNAIGTAGGEAKCALAREFGYADVIDYRAENFVQRVQEITGNLGVDAVFDSVGKDTMGGSLQCLKRHGTLVSFGQSSGAYQNFSISDLATGSLRLTRPTLFHFIDSHSWLLDSASQLFGLMASGDLVVPVNQRHSLDDVAQAQQALTDRATTGCTVLSV